MVLLFFSASPGKREIYVFPVLPAMCLAAAPLLPGLLRQRGVRRVLLAYLLIVASVVLAFGAAGLLGENPWAQRRALVGICDLRGVSWLIERSKRTAIEEV